MCHLTLVDFPQLLGHLFTRSLCENCCCPTCWDGVAAAAGIVTMGGSGGGGGGGGAPAEGAGTAAALVLFRRDSLG